MCFHFQKVTFWRKLNKKLAVFKSLPPPFGCMYFSETWHICLVILSYYKTKSARICQNIFWKSVIQSLKRGKTRKGGLVPMQRQEKLADLFLVFAARLETWPNVFHSYSFIKRFRNEAFRHFSVSFIKQLPWKPWPLEKFRLQFWLCISKFYDCTNFRYLTTLKLWGTGSFHKKPSENKNLLLIVKKKWVIWSKLRPLWTALVASPDFVPLAELKTW